MTQILYRFRCPSCLYCRDFINREQLPETCPVCDAAPRLAVVTEKTGQAEDRRH